MPKVWKTSKLISMLGKVFLLVAAMLSIQSIAQGFREFGKIFKMKTKETTAKLKQVAK